MNKRFILGFTLVELLVSISIMSLISTVIIYNHQKFNDNLEITNLSYEVALALRQAQIYGVSTKEFKEGTTEEERFNTPYGIYFNVRTYPTSFIFFADKDKDGRYIGSGATCVSSAGDVCLEKTNIGKGNRILEICELDSANNWECDGNRLDTAFITFQRPEPDARLKVNGGVDPIAVKICLVSPQDRIKEIVVYPTGQISIYDGDCPNGAGSQSD